MLRRGQTAVLRQHGICESDVLQQRPDRAMDKDVGRRARDDFGSPRSRPPDDPTRFQREDGHLEGYLKKKSPRAVGNVDWFQRRYVVLDAGKGRLLYFKDQQSRIHAPLGYVLFHDIVSVHRLTKYNGRRFDVHIGGKKMLALLAATEEEAAKWVTMICQLSSVKL